MVDLALMGLVRYFRFFVCGNYVCTSYAADGFWGAGAWVVMVGL